MLWNVIPPHVRNQILEVPMPWFLNGFDCWVWAATSSGSYSPNSGYHWLLSQFTLGYADSSWSWVWRIKAPYKVCFLIWMALHNLLPTNFVWFQHKMSSFDYCSLCGRESETIDHYLHLCDSSRRVWVCLGFNGICYFFSSDVKVWLKYNATSHHSFIFLAALWNIWYSRNERVFSDSHLTHHGLIRKILHLADLCSSIFVSNPVRIERRWVGWSMPQNNFVKLNCDGSSIGNPGRAGFGGLIWRANTEWVVGFSSHVNQADNLCVELLALRRGLDLAWSLGFRRVECEVDCEEVVRLINKPPNRHAYTAIIRDILRLLNFNWEYSIKHVYREGNQVADFLAKLGALYDEGDHVWNSPPASLGVILLADAAGVQHLR